MPIEEVRAVIDATDVPARNVGSARFGEW